MGGLVLWMWMCIVVVWNANKDWLKNGMTGCSRTVFTCLSLYMGNLLSVVAVTGKTTLALGIVSLIREISK